MMSLFISKQTWLHRWPAGMKLALLAAMSLLVLPISDWRWLAIGCWALMAVYLSFGDVGRHRVVALRGVLLLIAILGVFQAMLMTWQAGFLSALRIVFMVLLADLVSMTTPMQAMLRVMIAVLTPLRLFGVNTKRLALAVALMIRLISILFIQWQSQQSAWAARSPRKGSVRLLIPFITQALRHTDLTAEALMARASAIGESRPGASGHRSVSHER